MIKVLENNNTNILLNTKNNTRNNTRNNSGNNRRNNTGNNRRNNTGNNRRNNTGNNRRTNTRNNSIPKRWKWNETFETLDNLKKNIIHFYPTLEDLLRKVHARKSYLIIDIKSDFYKTFNLIAEIAESTDDPIWTSLILQI